MANTMYLLSSTTISTPAYSFTVNNIPQTYNDLLILCSIRSDYSNNSEGQFLINGISTSNYNGMLFAGDGSAVNGYSGTGQAAFTWGLVMNGSGTTANTFSNHEIYIPSYSNSSIAKAISTTGVTENNSSVGWQWMSSSQNPTTNAITNITFQAWQSFINFAAGSTFYIYGIKNN